MIYQSRQLSKIQLDMLLSLRTYCQLSDGNVIPIYPQLLLSERVHAGNFLYYENGCLIGFLAVFFFYEQAVEISLFVHPDWRHLGIAKQLLQASMPLLEREAVIALYFSRPQGPCFASLQRLGFDYSSSEYHLSLSLESAVSHPSMPLNIRRAEVCDLTALCAIDDACFGSDRDNEAQMQSLLANPAFIVLVGEEDGMVFAKVHLYVNDDMSLSNLAVLPHWRRRGYGRAMIDASIATLIALKKEKLSLDVESNNIHALDLYLQCGFSIVSACDYFIIDFLKFKAYCWDKSG